METTTGNDLFLLSASGPFSLRDSMLYKNMLMCFILVKLLVKYIKVDKSH